MKHAYDHNALASRFNEDEKRVDWHDKTLWYIREKRDKAAVNMEGWEQLRDWASRIKEHTLSNLHKYLIQFEGNAIANGVKVHWAADRSEHNQIILDIIRRNKIDKVVKSKSMLTEECRLNEYLKVNGIQVTDTDLGERIVQLRQEQPSHIVLPAIHLTKEQVGETFHQHLGTDYGANDPGYLTDAARKSMRIRFTEAQLAITGVNFAVAETGDVVVCTNEGNADIGVHASRIHIACMGIEKIIPRAEHLPVFLQLLARSATGQPITTYTSHFRRSRGNSEMHIVIVDNGRSRLLGRESFRNSLKCIRCGACFNTCPVYRRSGGHSYHNSVGGPIGSILSPNIDMRKNADLPFASTLCGSCSNVCPVKINIDEQLWKWRQVLVEEKCVAGTKRLSMKVMAFVLRRPTVYRFAGKVMRHSMRYFPFLFKAKLNAWYRHREMPAPPKQSFSEWFKTNEHVKP
jgi:L-lactate dehydrogenase complex protein LldF